LGPQDPGQVQIHDFNPGDLNPPGEPNYFLDDGVFWTRPVPDSSITIHPGKGDAHFRLPDFAMLDYFTVVNALFRNGPEPVSATASVDIGWQGTGERLQVENGDQGFSGQYENASGSIQWSASNADGYSRNVLVTHAFTAHVRTGVFHP
jgi:hypothetical protein